MKTVKQALQDKKRLQLEMAECHGVLDSIVESWVDRCDRWSNGVESYTVNEDYSVSVSYSTLCCGDNSTEYLTVPTDYFEAEDRLKFMSDWHVEKNRERLVRIELEKKEKADKLLEDKRKKYEELKQLFG